MDKYLGKLLDNRYEILEIVGVGGMASIYRARCRVLNRFVAIKILKDEFAQDEEFRRRFYMESQAVAKLSHPNIVAVYDVSHTEGLEYIVMELVEGMTLKDYQRNKVRLSWQETLYFAQQIARALSHAHSRGIIHQDIKPQNVMITNEGTAKVTDFGIASFAANQETRVVQEAIGSVHYISPEQAKGSSVDFRTDLYSLGVVMYEMLTGKLPFEGDTALSIVMQHISAMPLRPSEAASGVPVGMDEIVMHAMCPTVSHRYATADELFDDLQRLKADPDASFRYDGVAVRNDAPALDETQAIPRYQEIRRATDSNPATEYAPKPPSSAPTTAVREKEGISSTAIAIIAVVGFALIAVVIAFMLVFGSGSKEEKVEVDSFLNSNIIDVENNPEFTEKYHFVIDKVQKPDQKDGLIIKQDPVAGTKITKGSTVTLTVCVGNTTTATYTVEDFKGKSHKYVQTVLEREGITLVEETETSEEIDKDRAIRSDPDIGTVLEKGNILTVYFSLGKKSEQTAEMPNVVGKSITAARNTLSAFDIELTENKVASEKPKNEVVEQSISAGTQVKAGSKVTLDISSGIPPEPENTVPDVPETPPDDEPTQTEGQATIPVTIPPEAQENAHVVVVLDDETIIYDRTFAPAGASVDVVIKGQGSQYVTVYVNDVAVGSQVVTF